MGVIKVINETTNNSVTSTEGSIKGMMIAYGGILSMTVIPILIGSFISLNNKLNNVLSQTEFTSRVLTIKEIIRRVICSNISLYVFFVTLQTLPLKPLNIILSVNFAYLASKNLSAVISYMFDFLLSKFITNKVYIVSGYSFSLYRAIGVFACLVVSYFYLFENSWIANNLFCLGIATHNIESLYLENITSAFVLFVILFHYDIYWVFYTNTITALSDNRYALNQFMFPLDVYMNGFSDPQHLVLGVSDVVLPGIFMSFLLRFDYSLRRKSKFYFYTSFVWYLLGLLASVLGLYFFKRPQPALMYMVPCMSLSVFLAIIKGDFDRLLNYLEQKKDD